MALVLTPSVADAAPPNGPDQIANLITHAAPDQDVVGMSAADDGAVSTTSKSTVTAPMDPTKPFEMRSTASTEIDPIALFMPPELDLKAGTITDNGTVVYEAAQEKSGAAVQTLADGSVRFETIIGTANAPHQFTYAFGAKVAPTVGPDGHVYLTINDRGESTIVGTVGSPWAVDAAGHQVPTSYKVVGHKLVQTVTPGADVVYPIVADPTYSFGWALYLTWNKYEVNNVAPFMDYLNASDVICAVATPAGVWAVAACGAMMNIGTTYIIQTFQKAYASFQCVQISIPYLPSPALAAAQFRAKVFTC